MSPLTNLLLYLIGSNGAQMLWTCHAAMTLPQAIAASVICAGDSVQYMGLID